MYGWIVQSAERTEMPLHGWRGAWRWRQRGLNDKWGQRIALAIRERHWRCTGGWGLRLRLHEQRRRRASSARATAAIGTCNWRYRYLWRRWRWRRRRWTAAARHHHRTRAVWTARHGRVLVEYDAFKFFFIYYTDHRLVPKLTTYSVNTSSLAVCYRLHIGTAPVHDGHMVCMGVAMHPVESLAVGADIQFWSDT